jgi:hypothetical protein
MEKVSEIVLTDYRNNSMLTTISTIFYSFHINDFGA